MARPRGLSDPTELGAVVASRLPDAPIVVALSGGADSAVLAWAAAAVRPTRAVTIDHGLPASAALTEAARRVAATLGVEHRVIRVSPRDDSETELRRVRLAALEQACAPGEVVATGHTSDDVAETVLGNILRGSGTSGLIGIPAERGVFVRPMLAVSRAEVRLVADLIDLPYLDDPSNGDLSIRRNRLRLATLPRLSSDYNSNLSAALVRLAASAAGDDAVLEQRAAKAPIRVGDGAVRIPAAVLTVLPPAVATRVVRRALRLVHGPHPGTAADVAAVLEAASGAGVTIRGGVEVVREGPWVVLSMEEEPVPEPVTLLVGYEARFGPWVFGSEPGDWSVGRFDAIVPETSSLVVRPMQPADRIGIGRGSKDVAVALAEGGVPARLRNGWPVVADGDRIVWLPGVRSIPAPESGVHVWARRMR
jgi:tRNA(Ile)-lysidine synthase